MPAPVLRTLAIAVAALHVSHNLTIKFNCLKWDVTGTKPAGDVKSCAAPSRDKAMDLSRAIMVLKPDANARTEAKNAEKRAREAIKDASSQTEWGGLQSALPSFFLFLCTRRGARRGGLRPFLPTAAPSFRTGAGRFFFRIRSCECVGLRM